MNRISKWVVGCSVATASALCVGSGAIAQDNSFVIDVIDVDGVTQPRPQVDATLFPHVAETLGDRAVSTFYTEDQNYYENRSIGRQILWFFGLSHTENEVNRDGQRVSQFVQDMLAEQASSTATVRTLDLPNPYTSSLLLEPTIPEQQFPPTSIRQPISAPGVVGNPSVTAPSPVPALW